MTYTPTQWNDDGPPPISAANLNKLEQGVKQAAATADAAAPATHDHDDAAQVTALDPTTGRLAIGGIEMGDTGWRDVTGDLLNGWATAVSVKMRRVGSTVYLNLYLMDAASASSNNALSLPIGFRVGSSVAIGHVGVGMNGATGATNNLQSSVTLAGSTGDTVRLSSDASQTFTANVNFWVGDPWPTVLPGISV